MAKPNGNVYMQHLGELAPLVLLQHEVQTAEDTGPGPNLPFFLGTRCFSCRLVTSEDVPRVAVCRAVVSAGCLGGSVSSFPELLIAVQKAPSKTINAKY